MTNQEAIEWLQEEYDNAKWDDRNNEEWLTVLKMSMKALEYSDKLWEKAYKSGRESMLRDLKITDEVHEEAVIAVNDALNNLVTFLKSGNIEIKAWLTSFNTDSATECFTAIQKLKEGVMINDE